VELGVIGVEPDGLGQGIPGFPPLPQLDVSHPQVLVDLAPLGPQAGSLFEGLDGFGIAVAGGISQAKLLISLHIIRLPGNGLLKRGDGFIELVVFSQPFAFAKLGQGLGRHGHVTLVVPVLLAQGRECAPEEHTQQDDGFKAAIPGHGAGSRGARAS
jgi:hypothetical protein